MYVLTRNPSQSAPDVSASDGASTHSVSEPTLECTKQEQRPQSDSQDTHPSQTSETHADEGENTVVITCIQATDLALGLRRFPAGFYAVVQHSGHEWRTENLPVSVHNDVLEWNGLIPIPSESSASVSLEIRASFEFQPMLGDGERLRNVTAVVEELLDRSRKGLPFTFLSKDGDVVSPCSSLLVTVSREYRGLRGSSALMVVDPRCSETEPLGALEGATNEGHGALLRYRKYGEERDLELAMNRFQHALDICPLDHPCLAVAKSNLAMAKSTHSLVHMVDSDASVDIPLTLFGNALAARPVNHPDRASTLIWLATVHLARQRDDADAKKAGIFLREAMELSSAETHEHRVASFMLQLYADGQSCMGKGISSLSTDADPWTLSEEGLIRFRRSGDLADLQNAISLLEDSMSRISPHDRRYLVGLTNLGMALRSRFERLGEPGDLQKTISNHREAIRLMSDNHSDKPQCLNSLGISLVACFKRFGETSDLEEAILNHREAIHLTSKGDPHRPMYLNNLGISVKTRFERSGDVGDLEEAISTQQEAVRIASDADPEKPRYLCNLGTSFRGRFERLGDIRDLENAILRHKDAVCLIPDGHADKPGALDTLGTSFKVCFERLGKISDLEDAISNYRDALRLAPGDHPYRPECLNNLSIALFIRFGRLGAMSDLQEAISSQQYAVRLIPDGHPQKPAYLSNLGNSFATRFEHLDEIGDLEAAISHYQDALRVAPNGGRYKPGCLNDLGSCFLSRFNRLGDIRDLQVAILHQQDAVRLTQDGHPSKPQHLNNLGDSLCIRFKRLGDISDLEEAISVQRKAVCLVFDGHPSKPEYLSNLGDSLSTRFKRFGEISDLEEAITDQRESVCRTPNGHSSKPQRLTDLGNSLHTRFQHLGVISDLDEAISIQQEAVCITLDGHPSKFIHLNNLGISLGTRFKCLGEIGDLQDAISNFRNVIRLIPDGHPVKPMILNNFSDSLFTLFRRLGEINDLDEAILNERDAIGLLPDDHPVKSGCLGNLGNFLIARFNCLGEVGDLENAILNHRHAVCSTPDSHPDKPRRLSNLSISFITRFRNLGEVSSLEEAISNQQDVVRLTPDNHPNKPGYLNNLGSSFFTRFQCLGGISDLEKAVENQRDAVRRTPDGHPDKPGRLNTLGTTLRTRFETLGKIDDLEEAILIQRNAVRLTPDGHHIKLGCLNNLAISLDTRFQLLDEIGDLEEAISNQKNAISLAPDGHLDKPVCLDSLGSFLFARFLRLGDIGDLQDAISNQQEAVRLAPGGHLKRFGYLNNLGLFLVTRFKHLGGIDDLESAITIQRDAVGLTSLGHPDRPALLSNLGNSFLSRLKHLEEIRDMEEATSTLQEAMSTLQDSVCIIPDNHPDRPLHINKLAWSFMKRWEYQGDISNLHEALSQYSNAACASAGSVSQKFHASKGWIRCAHVLRHHSLLHAYSVAILLLPQLAWMGLSLAHRYRRLIKCADLVREAAAAALDAGCPETAVEWLEQGRSVVWGDMFQLRSSYDELSAVYPDYALRLRELSVALEHASVGREKISSIRQKEHNESLQLQADRHRHLAIQRDELLREIRRSPGFERFLLHKEFSQLRASAHSGPVVILNATKTRCDALIVLADVDHVIHVPLPAFTFTRCQEVEDLLNKFVGRLRGVPRDDRLGLPAPQVDTVRWNTVLAPLWKCVVKPVLDSLAISIPGELLRIFWCPTGPFTFLPIHAAGFYDKHRSQPGHKVYDFVISSYVPTLSILARSPQRDVAPSGDVHLLAVRQPLSDGLCKLPGAITELEHIKAISNNSPSKRLTFRESSLGTVEEVLALMKETDWVHLACHGIQDGMKPTESGLCLADQRRLSVTDIIGLSRPHGGLAFLSACQTAKGDEDLADEAIHIAAGMLFAGYGGVIATMWSISDRVAPGLTKDVYEQLFRSERTPDHREAAMALHNAVGRLREQNESFRNWLPFIHVGL